MSCKFKCVVIFIKIIVNSDSYSLVQSSLRTEVLNLSYIFTEQKIPHLALFILN